MPKAPQFCPMIYHDTRNIYLEFEGMVLPFPYSEAGLHKALKYIPNVQSHPGYFTGGSNLLKAKGRKVKVKTKGGVAISDEEAATMTSLLEDLKEDKQRK